jgi:photosystem II stability/assembly factor-like uncharacterized protein
MSDRKYVSIPAKANLYAIMILFTSLNANGYDYGLYATTVTELWATKSKPMQPSVIEVSPYHNGLVWLLDADTSVAPMYSSNFGKTWTRASWTNVSRLKYVNKTWIHATNGDSLKESKDGGCTWQTIYSNLPGVRAMQYIKTTNTIHLAGLDGYYVQYIVGVSLQDSLSTSSFSFPSKLEFSCIHFVDESVGLLIGNDHDASTGYIYTTSSGGRRWNIKRVMSGDTHYDCHMSTHAHAWVASNTGILTTDDGGDEWVLHDFGDRINVVTTPINSKNSIGHGWAISDTRILYTTDNWQTYGQLNGSYVFHPDAYMTSIAFLNTDFGLVGKIGDDSVINSVGHDLDHANNSAIGNLVEIIMPNYTKPQGERLANCPTYAPTMQLNDPTQQPTFHSNLSDTSPEQKWLISAAIIVAIAIGGVSIVYFVTKLLITSRSKGSCQSSWPYSL